MRRPDRSSLAVTWNSHPIASLSCETIGHLFEEQVDRTPDAIAIQLGSDQLTYRELDCRSNQLARVLVERGVKPETLVAVCFERSPDMIISMLAVLKAGAGYLPLDP